MTRMNGFLQVSREPFTVFFGLFMMDGTHEFVEELRHTQMFVCTLVLTQGSCHLLFDRMATKLCDEEETTAN